MFTLQPWRRVVSGLSPPPPTPSGTPGWIDPTYQPPNIVIESQPVDLDAILEEVRRWMATPTSNIMPGAIVESMLKDDSIATDKVQALAIGSAEIDDLAVTTAKINNLAVEEGKIGNLAVTTGKIDTLAVTDAKINDCTVTKLTTGNLTAVGTITTGSLVTGASPNARIELTSSEIVGYSDATTKQFYLSATDGKGYFGAGSAYLDADGLTLDGNAKKVIFTDNTPTTRGELFVDTTWFAIDAINVAFLNTNFISIGTGAQFYPSGTAGSDIGIANGTNEWNDIIALTHTCMETSTPTPVAGYGKYYTKNDNIPYFQDGGGTEKILLVTADVDDTPVDAATTVPVSSNWAYDHVAAVDPHTGYSLESLMDAKGDLRVGSADNTEVKLTVGTDGYILVADSGETSGLKWVDLFARGSYTGDGNDARQITTGFECSLVIIWDNTNSKAFMVCPGGAFWMNDGTAMTVTSLHASDGFTVDETADSNNTNAQLYYIWAIRSDV
jgi:hypothetical protein